MKEFLTHNLRLKLISLILAISLEFYFISPQNLVTLSLVAPVEVTNLPPNMVIMSPSDIENGLRAEFRVRGPIPLVQQLQTEAKKFTVFLPDNLGAMHSAQLDPKQLKVPSGVSVVAIEPREIEFRFERLLRKELAVNFEAPVEPAEGYRLVAKKVTPAAVMARGPESELRMVEAVGTQPTELLQNLRSTETIEVPLRLPGKHTTVTPNVVSVELVIGPKLAERIFGEVRVRVLAPPGVAATVSPSRVRVTVTGSQAALDGVGENELEAVADARELESGDHRLQLSTALPQGVELLKVEPERVAVTVVGKKGR